MVLRVGVEETTLLTIPTIDITSIVAETANQIADFRDIGLPRSETKFGGKRAVPRIDPPPHGPSGPSRQSGGFSE